MAYIINIFNFMGYNFSGRWVNVIRYQFNLFSGSIITTPYFITAAVYNYCYAGVSESKIMLGMPFYGRVFKRTSGISQPFSSVGNGL